MGKDVSKCDHLLRRCCIGQQFKQVYFSISNEFVWNRTQPISSDCSIHFHDLPQAELISCWRCISLVYVSVLSYSVVSYSNQLTNHNYKQLMLKA